MVAFLPTKVRLRNCTLGGAVTAFQTKSVKVYESMCTPYIKMQLTLIDNNGTIKRLADGLGSLIGQPVTIAFDGGEEIYERKEQIIFTVDSAPLESNKRVQVWNIGTVGTSYVNDRKALVQKSFKNIPATGAAAAIHNMFLGGDAPLNLISNSLGMIAKDTIGSFPISNVKPFKAIEDLLHRAKYASATNSTVYFRDRDSYVMAPLQDLFRSASAQNTFIEKATWGTNIRDMFEAHNAVISAGLLVEPGDISGARSKLGASAAAASQALNIFNFGTNKIDIDKTATATGLNSLVSAATSSFVNSRGGSMNNLLFNFLRNELSTDPSISQVQSEEFLAKVKDANKYVIKVPIRGGLKCTVGKGINARLLAPAGDQKAEVIGGLMLVADLMHDCQFDKQTVQATTTFRAVKVEDVS